VNDEETRAPRVVIIGGPNGAGKTTGAHKVLPGELALLQFVNADVIAAGLSGFAPETAAFQAGRIMLTRITELAKQRTDFSFETTLASRSFAPFLRRLKGEGYGVLVIYIWLRSPELAVGRVAARVRRGGHHVSAEDVRRRYARGLANFFELYRPVADSWILCDNSGDDLVVVARSSEWAVTEILNRGLYDEIQRSAGGERG
jgi:predicted ABC-type ATPase